MQDSFNLDELDLAIINTLQIAPRATWTDVGAVLDVNAATATRRWQRITDAGLAWVTAYPRLATWAQHYCVAFIEVNCEPEVRHHVIESLVRIHQVASVSQIASRRDLWLMVVFPDLQALSRFVLDWLSLLPGVRGTHTHTVTQFYSEANRWRLQALTPDQQTRLTKHSKRIASSDGGLLPTPCHDLILALGSDGRRTISELAALTSASVSMTRRRLDRVVQNDLVSFRCEVAQIISGWPVFATFWAQVNPRDLEATCRTLITMPEVRMCATVTGTANLFISVWLRSLGDSQRLERQLAELFPSLTLTERAVVLRMNKRMGWLLDDAGRGTAVVPIVPWEPAPMTSTDR